MWFDAEERKTMPLEIKQANDVDKIHLVLVDSTMNNLAIATVFRNRATGKLVTRVDNTVLWGGNADEAMEIAKGVVELASTANLLRDKWEASALDAPPYLTVRP
jgi:hypothetical protein